METYYFYVRMGNHRAVQKALLEDLPFGYLNKKKESIKSLLCTFRSHVCICDEDKIQLIKMLTYECQNCNTRIIRLCFVLF